MRISDWSSDVCSSDLEAAQHVIGDIDLPPLEALTRRGHVVVMVVVPALAERQQREQPVVAGIVTGQVALATEHMHQRVDAERRKIGRASCRERGCKYV